MIVPTSELSTVASSYNARPAISFARPVSRQEAVCGNAQFNPQVIQSADPHDHQMRVFGLEPRQDAFDQRESKRNCGGMDVCFQLELKAGTRERLRKVVDDLRRELADRGLDSVDPTQQL